MSHLHIYFNSTLTFYFDIWFTYRISSFSFRGNYSFFNLEIQRSKYINVRKLFKNGNYIYEEILNTIQNWSSSMFWATEGFPNFSFCSYLLGLRNRTHNQTQRRIVNKPCTFLDFSEKLHNGANVFLKSTICTYFSDSSISRGWQTSRGHSRWHLVENRGDISWTLLVTFCGHFCPLEILFLGDISWTFLGDFSWTFFGEFLWTFIKQSTNPNLT